MVINVLDHVPHCYTGSDGAVIASVIRQGFVRGEHVTVSFAGVTDVPSSFVNGAIVSLLEDYTFEFIRQNLSVRDSTFQINDMIRRRVRFVADQLVAA